MKRKPVGWRNHSDEHALASKGIKTRYEDKIDRRTEAERREIQSRIDNLYKKLDDKEEMKRRLVSLRKERPWATYHDVKRDMEKIINQLEEELYYLEGYI